ncbi:DUF7692 domain-containing protein [Haloarchaeobius baliensis]|uniref:DUF7692 domain-containing protein n=1 Tax=Haloarchaeobius baliensis TaxID=1670458 RepID=UPI003F88296D
MGQRDTPGSVRIRTDDGNEWRYDAIQAAANYYDCNRSDAVAYACEDMTGAVEFVKKVPQRKDLTINQRRELVELANLHLRGISFEATESIKSERC